MFQSNIELATEIALRFLGKPYVWGGDDPIEGFDCSGFVIEILKSVGILPRRGDWTAQMLWEMFASKRMEKPQHGCLVFWHAGGRADKIVHVEFCLNGTLSIGASGGGSGVKSIKEAIKQNAYIKIRPFSSRSNLAGFVDPFV